MTRRQVRDRLARWRLPRTKQYEGVRFLLHHVVGGVIGAVAFMALILATNMAGLRELFLETEHGLVAALLLLFGLMVTFGSVAMGIAVMLQGEDRS
jgi:multisubunit Na+/H+ antiporter MnhB subunit